ncbi:MAG TPA: hypothetical protein VGK67_13550 [Myxococcales bacterium]|jgi:hypothetical protein
MTADSTPGRAPADAALACVNILLSLKCDACDNAVPVNGPVPQVKCAKCGEVLGLTQGRLRWDQILNFHNPSITVFQFAASGKVGVEERGAWLPAKLTAIAGWPKCEKCGARHTAEAAAAGAASGAGLACGKCGKVVEVAPAPEFFRKIFPFVSHVAGAEVIPETALKAGAGGAVQAPSAGGASPVVMACMSCRASLPVDGSSRLVECAYCRSRNYLPDDLWFALHPATRREFWSALFDPSKARR